MIHNFSNFNLLIYSSRNMYRDRKKIMKNEIKCRVADRVGGKTKKRDGNPKITSKRLTLPPGFLCLGIKSETAQKSTENDKKSHLILNEDLHGLFYTNQGKSSTPLRRSSRILRKNNPKNLTASDYYQVLTSNCSSQESFFEPEPSREKIYKNRKGNTIQRNNSKSLFRKINEKYAKVGNENIKSSSLSNIGTPDSSSGRINWKFCIRLSEQLSIYLNQKATIQSKYKIIQHFETLNKILAGKLDPKEEMLKNNTAHVYKIPIIEEDPVHLNFNYIPRSQWVYATPPRQKINMPKIEQCQIQPAVIYSTKKQSTIYELQSNMDLDLSSYCNMENISIDSKYLRYVANFEHNITEDIETNIFKKNGPLHTNIELNNCSNINYLPDQVMTCDIDCNFIQPIDKKDNMFNFVTSRPKKTVEKVSRIGNILKCKIDKHINNEQCLYEHNNASSSYQTEQPEKDFTFIEDNGKYRIVNSQNTMQNTEFNFDFKRKLFHDEQNENMFSLKKRNPNFFDFSQLQPGDC